MARQKMTDPQAMKSLDLVETIGLTLAAATSFDSGRRNACLDTLAGNGAMITRGEGSAEIGVPRSLVHSFLPDTLAAVDPGIQSALPQVQRGYDVVSRTGVGYSGTDAGFGLAQGMYPDVVDRARQTVGPYSLCQWWPVTERMYEFPAANESSLADNSRYGGVFGLWGTGETTLPQATDTTVANVRFNQSRLMIQTALSRDIWEDAVKLRRWVVYVAMSEFRNQIEKAMIQGVLAGPVGAINAPSTVTVSKGSSSSSTISVANAESMWEAISEDNSERAVWHANKNTIQYLDSLAVSGQFPPAIYFPAGMSPVGTMYGTIFGKPLIPSKFCAILGNPGDLICSDWSDYVFTYLQPPGPDKSPLSFYVDIPDDSFHRGIKALPPDAVETRVSDEVFFSTDRLALVWRFRGAGSYLWNNTVTSYNGGITQGPASITAQR